MLRASALQRTGRHGPYERQQAECRWLCCLRRRGGKPQQDFWQGKQPRARYDQGRRWAEARGRRQHGSALRRRRGPGQRQRSGDILPPRAADALLRDEPPGGVSPNPGTPRRGSRSQETPDRVPTSSDSPSGTYGGGSMGPAGPFPEPHGERGARRGARHAAGRHAALGERHQLGARAAVGLSVPFRGRAWALRQPGSA